MESFYLLILLVFLLLIVYASIALAYWKEELSYVLGFMEIDGKSLNLSNCKNCLKISIPDLFWITLAASFFLLCPISTMLLCPQFLYLSSHALMFNYVYYYYMVSWDPALVYRSRCTQYAPFHIKINNFVVSTYPPFTICLTGICT